MSHTEDRHEAGRWLKTAEEDLQAAKALQQAGMYAHACFLSQQCGEKAVKAIWYLISEEPWGHSIQRLVMQFPKPELFSERESWLQRAASLDKFYIPTRYPNGLPDLTPGQSYFNHDAIEAIEQAAFFLESARELLT